MKPFEQRIREALTEMRELHAQGATQIIPAGSTMEEAREILDEKYIEILGRHLYLYSQLELLFLSVEGAENMASVRQSSLYKMLVYHQYLEELDNFHLEQVPSNQ